MINKIHRSNGLFVLLVGPLGRDLEFQNRRMVYVKLKVKYLNTVHIRVHVERFSPIYELLVYPTAFNPSS